MSLGAYHLSVLGGRLRQHILRDYTVIVLVVNPYIYTFTRQIHG